MDAINFQSSVARMRQAAAMRAFEAMPGVNKVKPLQSTSDVRAAGVARDSMDVAQIQNTAQTSAARSRIVSKLVAATVPGTIDFSTSGAPTQNTSIPLYKHPADKNAAATGVWSGRAIDVEG